MVSMAILFPCLKLMIIWTFFTGVLIIQVDRTNFYVITRKIVKGHRFRLRVSSHHTEGHGRLKKKKKFKNYYTL